MYRHYIGNMSMIQLLIIANRDNYLNKYKLNIPKYQPTIKQKIYNKLKNY